MTALALESCSLSKTFSSGFFPKKVEALKGLSFQVPEGKVTGFLGPNGSGKSTFLKVATDFISPTAGEVKFFGDKKFKNIKRFVGFVPEKPNYPGNFKGIEILKFHSKIMGINNKKIDEVISLVELGHAVDRAFGTYSKGMRQRLAIAQALLADPRMLILDEPLSGLDPDGREVLIQAILGFSKQEGKTVILSSHLLEDLQRICNNLVVINEGELLFSGDPSAVFHPDQFFIRYLKGSEVKDLKVSKDDLNQSLTQLIEEKDVEIQFVEPETKAISSLYFELTRGVKR